jgi:hypothetical protein
MKRLLAAGILAAGAAFPWPTPADAGGYGSAVVRVDFRGHRDGAAFRHGYDRGWREGADEGYRDARRRLRPRFWREAEYRDADRGYRWWMGLRWEYEKGFRSGYEAGYRRAYAASRPGWRGRGPERADDQRHRRRHDGRYEDDRR